MALSHILLAVGLLHFFSNMNRCILLLQLTEEFEEVPVQSRGFGILDVGYRSTVKCSFIQRIALLSKQFLRVKV